MTCKRCNSAEQPDMIEGYCLRCAAGIVREYDEYKVFINIVLDEVKLQEQRLLFGDRLPGEKPPRGLL